jgi:thiol-disulfide isomerase/thioredoxin
MLTRRGVLCGAAALVGFGGSAQGQTDSPDVGTTFPDLRFVNPARQGSSIGQLSTRPKVIYMWASWCPICEGDLPNIAAVRARLGGDSSKVGFLLLNFLEPFATGQAWATSHGIKLPLSESDSTNRSTPMISASNGGKATFSLHTPQLYIVDVRGVVRWRNRGGANRQEMLCDTLIGMTIS